MSCEVRNKKDFASLIYLKHAMAHEANIDRKRLYKNSVKLYLRTFYTLAVGLYNSRVVLEVLGIDDFGVYSLVGSLVVMFGFFSGTMSSAMSRFFSFEIASGDSKRLHDTFGTALVIVSAVAALILLAGEAVGYLFLGDLNIPEQTRGAAAVVYQFSLATVIVTVLQTCYLSTLIAHEHMGMFAILDMLTTTLKLAAIFALKFIDSEKLILYSALVFCVTLSTTTVTIIYCRRHFAECRAGLEWHKPLMGSLLTYSGWNLFKTLCDTLRPAGINVVVNLFFGVMINGAVGIAMTVSSNLAKFTANVFLAFKPQIIKSFAIGNLKEMSSIMTDTFRFSILVLSLIVVPIFLEMHYVLTLWLGQCPPYAAVFCRLLCIAMYFEVMIAIIEFGINATGNIRRFCVINGLMTVSTVGFGWIAYKWGAPPPAIYVIQIVMGCFTTITDATILHRLVPQLDIAAMIATVWRIVLLTAAVFGACFILYLALPEGLLRFLLIGSTDVVLMGFLTFMFVLTPAMRQKVLAKVRRRS